ncbi:Nucleic acid-binding, OB-fold [Sesbania bispinosa]|nr:Nucleic acid-binding, OB-fold [Sesbania bispinosa]
MSGRGTIFIPVSEISPTMKNWCISAQVIRIWNVPFCYDNSRILSVEMVFIDALGCKLQASVSKDLLKLRKLYTEEGNIYYFGSVVVVPNDGTDRPTRHPFRLVFHRQTWVQKAVDLRRYTPYGMSPSNSSEILRMKQDTEHLVDKVGLLTSVSCEREYTKDDKDLLAAYMEITDPTGKVEVVVYDEYLRDLVEFLRTNGTCTTIIMVQFARVVPDAQVIFGDLGLETVNYITMILFNPPIAEVFDMREWLVLSGMSLDRKIQYRNMDMPCGGCFVICATITALVENEAWWFSACCPHACSSKGSSLFTCDGNFSVVPRYFVKVEVSDGKDLTHLQIGDEDIEKLVNVSCTELLSKMENPNSTTYPKMFNTLLGERRIATPCNHDQGSSYASALPGDNFTPQGSAKGISSSAGSASVNNLTKETSSMSDLDPVVEKHCIYFTRRTE